MCCYNLQLSISQNINHCIIWLHLLSAISDLKPPHYYKTLILLKSCWKARNGKTKIIIIVVWLLLKLEMKWLWKIPWAGLWGTNNAQANPHLLECRCSQCYLLMFLETCSLSYLWEQSCCRDKVVKTFLLLQPWAYCISCINQQAAMQCCLYMRCTCIVLNLFLAGLTKICQELRLHRLLIKDKCVLLLWYVCSQMNV